MCGRFTLRSNLNTILQELAVETTLEIPPNYNVAPTDEMPVCRISDGGGREIASLRWGLVPFWAKDPKIGYRTINARSESVADKPAFRDALKRRRCLVLADGYYEWKKDGKHKQPYYIRLKDGRPFTFAGLWDRNGQLETFTVITTDANKLTAAVHDRMPAILDDIDRDLWLDHHIEDKEKLLPLLRPFDAGEMTMHPVDRRVGNVRNNDPACIEAITT